MLDSCKAKTPRNGPKLFVSDSLMLAAQAGCAAADRLRGGVEVAWSAYGQWTIAEGDRFGAIYLSHPFLLKAECGFSWFRVKPADLSALGRRVSESHPHLTVLGQIHRHPGIFKPTPSHTDDEDREKIANLLRDCAEREVVERWEVPPHLPRVGTNGDARQMVEYAIDPRLVISMWPRSGSLRSRILPVRSIARAPTVTCTRRLGLSYQVFLVFNAKADRDAIYAQVMEFRRLPFGEDVSTLFDDWEVEILPDAETAARLKDWGDFTAAPLEQYARALAAEKGLKNSQVFHPLRVAISGRTMGPSLFHMMEFMGRDKVIKRLNDCIKKFY